MLKDDVQKIWSYRLHLAQVTKGDVLRITLFSVIAVLLGILYHYQGNTTHVSSYGVSAIKWMASVWNAHGFEGDYSHGWLIPIVSLAVIWLKRAEFFKIETRVSHWGLAVFILGLLFHWLGAKSQQTRISLFGLITILWGIPFYLYGWQVARILIFPCAYLIFCIPLNFLNTLTFPLRIFMTIATNGFLNGVGIEATRTGSSISAAVGGGFDVDVADPCSGLRSLLALTAIAAVYAYFTQRTLVKKWALFLMSIPLAVIGNLARIVTIVLVAGTFGEEIATGLYHDYSGYIFFTIAVSLMIGIGNLLSSDFKAELRKWKERLLSPLS